MKIAILLATYNAEKHIRGLLDSLLNQTFNEFEIFYHDDGSKDETLSIMAEYEKDNPGKIFAIPGTPTGGAKQNFMYMLSKVEADYYLFCDDDDVWDKTKVEKELAAIKNKEKPTAAFCDLKVVDEDLNIISPTFFSYVDRNPLRTALGQLLIENMATGCSMAINRSLRDIAIKLDDLDLILMHDHFLMALAAMTGEVRYLDEPLILYRQTGENEVGAEKKTILGKIARNLNDIFSGRVKKEKEAFHQEAYNLAKALLLVTEKNSAVDQKNVGLDDQNVVQANRGMLSDFLKTQNQSKLKRISFYKKHNINKNSGNLWYYLWL